MKSNRVANKVLPIALKNIALKNTVSKRSASKNRGSKARQWLGQLLCHGTILAGTASAWVLVSTDLLSQDPLKPGSAQVWKNSGPWRAIGIAPRKTSAPSNQGIHQIHGSGLVRSASTQTVVAELSEDSASPPSPVVSTSDATSSEPTGVVSAIATTQSREPSLVKVPSMKIPAASVPSEPSSDTQTSRSIGAKVRLSMSTVVDSASQTTGSTATNSSNLKVTRSGDITAETPVKINFNQERILALPALPSPNSPYAESGIEIPVRVEAVAETVQSILDTPSPVMELPNIGVLPAPQMELQAPELPAQPPVLEEPAPAVPELAVPALKIPAVEPESPVPQAAIEMEPEESLVEESDDSSASETTHKKPGALGPVSAAPTIVPLPSIEATSEEIEAISKLSRSTQAKADGVLSQPGAPVLITTGPMVSPAELEPDEKILLETQDIRALQVNGSISRLHIVDSSICQVVCNGNRMFVVADQTGETLIEVNMGKMHKPMYVKVVVQRPWARSSAASVSLDQMQDIVSRLAPSADVSVQPTEEGSLVVCGFADNKQQAKKVLEAIRKMVLVPVIDKLEIR